MTATVHFPQCICPCLNRSRRNNGVKTTGQRCRERLHPNDFGIKEYRTTPNAGRMAHLRLGRSQSRAHARLAYPVDIQRQTMSGWYLQSSEASVHRQDAAKENWEAQCSSKSASEDVSDWVPPLVKHSVEVWRNRGCQERRRHEGLLQGANPPRPKGN